MKFSLFCEVPPCFALFVFLYFPFACRFVQCVSNFFFNPALHLSFSRISLLLHSYNYFSFIHVYAMVLLLFCFYICLDFAHVFTLTLPMCLF